MKFVNKENIDESMIKRLDESRIHELSKLAFTCQLSTEVDSLRDIIYQSKYNKNDMEEKEQNLELFLKSLQNLNIQTTNQNKEYKWIKINAEKMREIQYRFYIAPDPKNMHDLVKKLIIAFNKLNVPVRLKYQLITNMESCDRIIIYSDAEHKELVKKAMNSVYQNNLELLNGYERSLAWIYETDIKGVFLAPETKEAYSRKFCEAIQEAYQEFCFLYGLKKGDKVHLEGKEVETAYHYMDTLITSILLRKGLLLSKDERRISIKDKNIKSYYNAENKTLTHINQDERGYFEVTFLPTNEGRHAFLENFYSVSKTKPQNGIIMRYLTLEERKEEINRILYPHKYKIGDSQSFKR